MLFLHTQYRSIFRKINFATRYLLHHPYCPSLVAGHHPIWTRSLSHQLVAMVHHQDTGSQALDGLSSTSDFPPRWPTEWSPSMEPCFPWQSQTALQGNSENDSTITDIPHMLREILQCRTENMDRMSSWIKNSIYVGVFIFARHTQSMRKEQSSRIASSATSEQPSIGPPTCCWSGYWITLVSTTRSKEPIP